MRTFCERLLRVAAILTVGGLLYFLSIGPIAAWAWSHNYYPPTIRMFLGPITWLDNNTFLECPIETYARWWVELWPKD